jgi:hypothetical protein
MLKNPDGPNSVERIVRERHAGSRRRDKRLVIAVCNRWRKIQPRIVRHYVLQIAPARSNFQDALVLETVEFREPADRALYVIGLRGGCGGDFKRCVDGDYGLAVDFYGAGVVAS